MSRLGVSFSVVVLMLALMACSPSERPAAPEGATAPPVSSQGMGAAPPPAAPQPAAVEPEPMADPQAESCLALVRQARFQEALPVCTAALQNNPADAQVRGALDQAKAETAKAATSAALGQVPGAPAAAEAAGAAQAGAEAVEGGAAQAGAEAVEGGAASQVEGAAEGAGLPE
jgi:hypothetical protein